jgi:hypothetical protein
MDPQFKDVLTPVLADDLVWETTLYIVYASRKFVPLKIRTFTDLFLELARRDATPHRRSAPRLDVGTNTTNGRSRSSFRFSPAANGKSVHRGSGAAAAAAAAGLETF